MFSRFALVLLLTFGAAARSPAAESTYLLKKLLIADTKEKAAALSPELGGARHVFVQDVPVLADPTFSEAVAPYFGRAIDTELLNDLIKTITSYAQKHDRYLTHIEIPNQNITAGALRLAVVVGRYSDLTFRGNHWFSSKLLEEKLGIKPGDEVRLSVLEQAVAWANTNPFRQIKVFVNDLKNAPGKADLIVGVQERRPYRVSFSYDDAGNAVLGNNRYTGSIEFGNLWGIDHQASYLFTTSDDPRVYRAHALSYKVPLPWRHFVELSASYVQVNPTIAEVINQHGQSVVADLRYTVPLRGGENPAELFAGVDFKQSNNNLEYGGTSVLANKTDTLQAMAGFSFVSHDRHGGWYFSAMGNMSPGGITSLNDRETYSTARLGSSPTYVYGTVSFQRLQSLGHGWDLSLRGTGQVSSVNLLPNEQLTLGGPTTIRGFNTNQVAADEGYLASLELQTPVVEKSLQALSKRTPPLRSRFLAFYDAGSVWFKHRYGFDPKLKPLASAGVGLRMSVGTSFSVSADYGWQLTDFPYPLEEHARGHLKVVLAF